MNNKKKDNLENCRREGDKTKASIECQNEDCSTAREKWKKTIQ